MKKFKVLFSIFFLALSLFVGFGNPQISEAKTTNTKAVTTAQPFIVYQDDKVIIMFKKITSRGVVFDVQNLTNINITDNNLESIAKRETLAKLLATLM